jgi:hypothetical protein
MALPDLYNLQGLNLRLMMTASANCTVAMASDVDWKYFGKHRRLNRRDGFECSWGMRQRHPCSRFAQPLRL